ncbi:MAG TPA: GNAT family N-acetyltransferase, partial [Micropepsaceae bacterium]
MGNLILRDAVPQDAELIATYVRELAEFERLSHECIVSAADFRRFLFEQPRAHAMMAEWDGEPAGFALYFYNFSTFLGRPGLYLEDLFVRPAFRRNGIARGIFQALARKAVAEDCGRFEWSVLDWNE